VGGLSGLGGGLAVGFFVGGHVACGVMSSKIEVGSFLGQFKASVMAFVLRGKGRLCVSVDGIRVKCKIRGRMWV
jgi:hypothetical protein